MTQPPSAGRMAPTRHDLVAELEQARLTFHGLLDQASPADLRRASRGTRWTNEQLLFHMLFGYLILRALRVLVKAFGRLPAGVSQAYARLLTLALHMHFPTAWDPFFTDVMTLAEVYHYATQHFDFHRDQRTLDQA